jgi:uncharacterized protein
MKNEIERRTMKVEFKTGMSGVGTPMMHGVAAVFNSMSEDLGGFREMIAPGAFKSALMGSDVRALFNHDPSMILGRTTSGTLRLTETDQGLEFDVDPPDTTYARDLVACMQRGDINQCSFGFNVDAGGDTWQKDATGQWTRTIHVVSRLYDVSPVTFPAYPDTACAMRSLEKIKAESIPPCNDTDFRKFRLELEEALL